MQQKQNNESLFGQKFFAFPQKLRDKLFRMTGMVFSLFFLVGISNARLYPLKEITLSNCSGEECTIELPKIKNADYYSYRNTAEYRRVYSMLWLGTYFERRDVGIGSHQGVDVATTTGTPVYASHEGEVIFAGWKGDWGNVIVIKHIWNNQILYTTYAHLSKIEVEVGDTVSEGTKIGEVGATGNTTGPHLHFQIETNQDGNHPFFPKGCAGSIDEIVNEGNCFDQVRKSTIDPIYFLEVTTKLSTTPTEKPSGSIYLKGKDIQISGFVGGFLETNSSAKITFSQGEKSGGEFLSNPISVSVNDNYLSVSPKQITVLEGERNMFFQSNATTGLALVSVKYGDEVLHRFPVLINDKAGIETWKNNVMLMEALKLLGISV